ncbi:MAG: PLP-dependent aminotransferase family protein [Actinomycetota bacterium]
MAASLSGPQVTRLLGSWRSTGPTGPGYDKLATGLRALVLDGRVPLTARFPAERALAQSLGLSRTTVAAAYDRLRSEGFLVSRRGSGSYAAIPAGLLPAASRWARGGAGADVIDLSLASPEPPAMLAEAVQRAGGQLALHAGHGYDGFGLLSLREALAERFTARGLRTTADQLVITSGALAAIDLVARTVLGPRDLALVESPTYPNAMDAMRRAGARLQPVGLVPGGWDVELVTSAIRQSMPRLAFLVPDFNNPTGQLLDDAGRSAIVAAARRSGTLIVADETLVDLVLDGDLDLPLPMAAHDRDDTAVTIGSASKSYWGGLRMGWIRASRPLTERLVDVRRTVDMGSPVLEQLVLLELLQHSGDLLAARRAALNTRLQAVETALGEYCPDWQWVRPVGGLSLWVELSVPMSTSLAQAASTVGVRLIPGPRFAADGTLERYVRLPFALPEAQLVDAVQRLARARDDVHAGVPVSFTIAPVA